MPGDYQGWYSQLPGLPQPFIERLEATGQEGSPYNSFIEANPALGGQYSKEVLGSPFFAQEYWQNQGITPQQAALYGYGQQAYGADRSIPLPGDLSGYAPGNLYNYLVANGMQPINEPAPMPSGGGMNVGGLNVGGPQQGVGNTQAGRIAPSNPITGMAQMPRPEVDARTEAVFGSRKPISPAIRGAGEAPAPAPVPGTSAAEMKPFGMTNGFQVAPGGTIGTGGTVSAQPFGTSNDPRNRVRTGSTI
jgi:hypothetical protein